MKKTIYICLFTIFGILFQFFIHAVAETMYIGGLVNNFSTYSLSLSWEQWFSIHYVFTIIFFIGGLIFGLWGGFFFWQKIYVEKRYLQRKKKI